MAELGRIVGKAALGAAGTAAAGATLAGLGYGLIQAEAKITRKIVGNPFDGAPDDDGVYGAAPGEPVQLLVLGDSTAAGMGADNRFQTIGAILATGLAAIMGRPVELTNEAVVGAESSDLSSQLSKALERIDQPDVAVILIGANDVTHRIDRSVSVQHLQRTVRYLRTLGVPVVVGTCPDLGTVEPVPFPLNKLLRQWSRELAAAQTVAAVEAGARTVSMGDLLGPEFAASPSIMFSQDRFHPPPRATRGSRRRCCRRWPPRSTRGPRAPPATPSPRRRAERASAPSTTPPSGRPPPRYRGRPRRAARPQPRPPRPLGDAAPPRRARGHRRLSPPAAPDVRISSRKCAGGPVVSALP